MPLTPIQYTQFYACTHGHAAVEWPEVGAEYEVMYNESSDISTSKQAVTFRVMSTSATIEYWRCYILKPKAGGSGGTVLLGEDSTRHVEWVDVAVPPGQTVTVTRAFDIHNIYFGADVRADIVSGRLAITNTGYFRLSEKGEYWAPTRATAPGPSTPLNSVDGRFGRTNPAQDEFYFGLQVYNEPVGPLPQAPPELPPNVNVKTAKLGIAAISIDVTMKANEVPQQQVDIPGGLYPMIARAFEVEDYRLYKGWPVPIPKYDIHANAMVSATGEVFTDRDDPTAVQTGALLRWVADAETFDTTSLRWSPTQNLTGQPVHWQTSVQYAPVVINDYEYRIKDERFLRDALNFDSDSKNHMWADFSSTIGGSSGFTVIMVLSPNSTFGNNIDVPYNGLFCPKTLDDSWMSLTMQGNFLYLDTEVTDRAQIISIAPALNSNAPLMVAVVFDRPETTFYVGPGPSSIRTKSVPSGSYPVALSNEYFLGRSTEDVLHTADMALFDFGIYANRLSAAEVADQFSLLSQCYGGDA